MQWWEERRTSDNDNYRPWSNLKQWERAEVLPDYIESTHAVVFVDDAHKLQGRKLQIARECILASRIFVMSASEEQRLAPNLRGVIDRRSPQTYRLGTEVAYDMTKPLVWMIVVVAMGAGCSASFAQQATELELPPKPPEVGPYQLPTFSGKPARIDNKIRSLVKAPRINGDVLFKTIMQCYPTISKWRVDVALRAGTSTKRLASDFGTDLGKNYVQIVANMPLYSTSEVEKAQDREYKRRQETAQGVSLFVAAIAERNHAIRELSLYQSLESRASLRVNSGFIAASEQVSYLEKVAKAQETLIKSEADIMSSRIALSAQCRSNVYKNVNDWLTRLSAVPKSKWESPLKVSSKETVKEKEDPLLIEWGKSLGLLQ